jgi:hypothetical protein
VFDGGVSRADVEQAVRGVIDANLPDGLVIAPRYRGMTTWVVPLERCPKTYDRRPLPVLALGERTSYVSLLVPALFFMGGVRDWLDAAWQASGCPLTRGEVTLQLRRLDDIPFDVLAELVSKLEVDRVVAAYSHTTTAARLAR